MLCHYFEDIDNFYIKCYKEKIIDLIECFLQPRFIFKINILELIVIHFIANQFYFKLTELIYESTEYLRFCIQQKYSRVRERIFENRLRFETTFE